MSYDFSNIRMMSDSSGKEMHKIVNSSGNVVWQKPYVWQQFGVHYTYRYNYTEDNNLQTMDKLIGNISGEMIAWTSYTINQDNGSIAGSGEKFQGGLTQYGLNDYYSEYPYITFFDGNNVFWRVVARLSDSSYGFTYYEGYTVLVTDSSSCGSSTGKYFMSTTANAYPVDGEKNGYWYKRIQIGYSA